MSTITAMQPRPYVITREVAHVNLVQAKLEDIRLFNPVTKQYQRRLHLIYWLKSSLTGKMEPTPRILTEQTDPYQIKIWMHTGMLYVAQSQFTHT